MTPKEKAEELVFKYDFLQAVIEGFSFYDAKECALIAVDEIIFYLPSVDIYPYFAQKLSPRVKEYWQEVKQEINKLWNKKIYPRRKN